MTGSTGPIGPNYYTEYTVSPEMTGPSYDLYSDIGIFDIYQINTIYNPINITLPSITSLTNNKRIHTFTDVGGNLFEHTFTLLTDGVNTVANSTSVTLVVNYSSITVSSNCNDKWLII
jgi:hypothetical protein